MAIIYNGTNLTNIKFGDTNLTAVWFCDTSTSCCTLVFPKITGITVPDCIQVGFPDIVYFNYNTAAIGDSVCYPGFDIICKARCSNVCSYFECRGNAVPLCTCITVTGNIPTGVCLIAYPQDASIEQDTNNYRIWASNNACSTKIGSWNDICGITFSPVTINNAGTHNITNSYTVSFSGEGYPTYNVLGTCFSIYYYGIDICSCVLYDLYVGTTKVLSCVPASCINSL